VALRNESKNKFRKLDGLVDVASLNEHEPTEITEHSFVSSVFSCSNLSVFVLTSSEWEAISEQFLSRLNGVLGRNSEKCAYECSVAEFQKRNESTPRQKAQLGVFARGR
jgi:hypothetical protein